MPIMVEDLFRRLSAKNASQYSVILTVVSARCVKLCDESVMICDV